MWQKYDTVNNSSFMLAVTRLTAKCPDRFSATEDYRFFEGYRELFSILPDERQDVVLHALW
jgi:hypothetical protein